MRRIGTVTRTAATLLLLLGPFLVPGRASAQPAEPGARVPDEYIVTLRDTVRDPGQVANEHAQQHGLAVRHVYEHALRGYAARIPSQRLAMLRADSRVQLVEPVVAHELLDQGTPTGIHRIEADLNPAANNGVNVAIAVGIIDTGIQKNHPDLEVKGGFNATGGRASDWDDKDGHGTHVAGIVGALDNTDGVRGVAPGADLYAVRVCKSLCLNSDMVKGIDWMAGEKGSGRINFGAANMSIGTADDDTACHAGSDAVHRAICGLISKGVVFAMAAGNDGRVKRAYPEVLAVAALADYDGKAGGKHTGQKCREDVDDTLANFSNYAAATNPTVDLAAPGVCIYSTYKGSGYSTLSGTSMASPYVAGAAALYLHVRGGPGAVPKDKSGADAVANAIVAAALPKSHACGYQNERGTGEPLLYVNGNSPSATDFNGSGQCDGGTGLVAAP